MNVEALFPLYPPLRFDADIQAHLFQSFVSKFKAERTIAVHGSYFHDGEKLSFLVEPCSSALKRRYFQKTLLCRTGDWLLRVHGRFGFPGRETFFMTDSTGKKVDQTEDELRSTWISMLPDMLDPTIQTYICSLAIGFSGVVRPIANVWLLDGKRHHFSCHYVSTLHESIKYLVSNGVEPNVNIGPEKVTNWVFSQRGMFDGYSNTPAARSLNYFTRLFVREFRNDELAIIYLTERV